MLTIPSCYPNPSYVYGETSSTSTKILSNLARLDIAAGKVSLWRNPRCLSHRLLAKTARGRPSTWTFYGGGWGSKGGSTTMMTYLADGVSCCLLDSTIFGLCYPACSWYTFPTFVQDTTSSADHTRQIMRDTDRFYLPEECQRHRIYLSNDLWEFYGFLAPPALWCNHRAAQSSIPSNWAHPRVIHLTRTSSNQGSPWRRIQTFHTFQRGVHLLGSSHLWCSRVRPARQASNYTVAVQYFSSYPEASLLSYEQNIFWNIISICLTCQVSRCEWDWSSRGVNWHWRWVRVNWRPYKEGTHRRSWAKWRPHVPSVAGNLAKYKVGYWTGPDGVVFSILGCRYDEPLGLLGLTLVPSSGTRASTGSNVCENALVIRAS